MRVRGAPNALDDHFYELGPELLRPLLSSYSLSSHDSSFLVFPCFGAYFSTFRFFQVGVAASQRTGIYFSFFPLVSTLFQAEIPEFFGYLVVSLDLNIARGAVFLASNSGLVTSGAFPAFLDF